MPTLYEVNGKAHVKDPDKGLRQTLCSKELDDSEINSIKSFSMYFEGIPFDGKWCEDCYATALSLNEE